MNILSLFDGISCAKLALDKIGIPINRYYSSEIDKYAIKVAQSNYPDTIQLGDVTKLNSNNLPKIDLLIGGSPCQGFSVCGKHKNFNDPRSKLFFEFIRLLEETKPLYFLLENVSMKKEWEDIITSNIGTNPIQINSNLVSAQNRKRLYWTNIQNIEQPKDKNIYFKDIREYNVADNFYYTDKALSWIKLHEQNTGKKLRIIQDNDKLPTITASYCKKYSNQQFIGIEDAKGLRFITPLECERAQTIPDNYTNHVSNTQRYKMIGNAMTVEIISHILSYL
jgi:DNA-cytosine methyltransferase